MMDLGRRILVVEDERIVAKDIQRSLQRLGYDAPDTAASAEEAMRCSAVAPPDLVLMDIRIEGDLDGIQTAAMLRERFDVPVVFLTAHADAHTVNRVKEIEPYGYLLKPVRPDELRTTVEIALHKHRTDKHVRERERWFSTTLRSIDDAIVTVDAGNRITYMNPAAEMLTGSTFDQVEGVSSTEVLDLLDYTHAPLNPSPMEAALRDRRVVKLPDAMLRQRSTGALLNITDSAAVVTENDLVLGAVMVFSDTTEQRRLQEQVITSERMASIGMLAAGVAHEINNPLAAALMNLDLTTEAIETMRRQGHGSALLDELLEGLRDTTAACDRVRAIVGDLRVFSRADVSTTEAVDVHAVMESTLRIARTEIRHRARVVRISQPVPPIQATESRLGQVFLNLIVNAAQAIPEGAADTQEIRITTGTDRNGHALIEIADTGVGMPLDVQQRLFTPFFTTKSATHGTGLGLMLCRRIVDLLNGTLCIESVQGKGTTVRVTFPPCAVAKPHVKPAEPQPAIGKQRGRILLIDDDAIVATTIERVLRDGHDVITFQRADLALERLRAGEVFDVILCDLMMPLMTGMDLHAELLQSHPQLAARMVFMTGGAFTPRAQAFLESVTTPALDKPFDRITLLKVVADLVERARSGAT